MEATAGPPPREAPPPEAPSLEVLPPELHGEEWRHALAGTFNGLVPDHPGAAGLPPARGRLAGAQLGEAAAFQVAGGDQVLRRTAAASRRRPSDLLKVCIQRAGTATIAQGGREVRLTPGSMTIYDIDQPYLIALQGEWRCSVIAFPRSAVAASRLFVDRLICRPALVTDGPGAVLAPLVAAAVAHPGEPGAARALVGRASVDLVVAALAEQHRPGAADAVRLQVDAYIRAHLAEPGLSHATVAAAHHMSGRTLHRLFSEPGPTVTELIRGYRLDRILAGLRSPATARDSISQVAARWGVHDMPHFSRAFRARYGMTPTQARQTGPPPSPAAG